MANIYELVATYKTWVSHRRSGDTIHLVAQVFRSDSQEHLNIDYSHLFLPKEGSVPWASDSYTNASTLDEAKTLFQSWAQMMEKSHEVRVWGLI